LSRVQWWNVKYLMPLGRLAKADSKKKKKKEEEVTVRSSSHTRLVTNDGSALVELTHLYQSSKKLSICAVFSGLQEIMDRLGDTLVGLVTGEGDEGERFTATGGGEGGSRVRCLTSFTNEKQTHLVEMFLRIGIQVRHIADFPSLSFTLVENDNGLLTLILGLWQSLLISTDPAYTKHFQQYFDQLWSCGTNADSRIDEIRSGSDLTEFEVIGNPEEAMKRIWDGISDAREVLVLLSSPSMLRLQTSAGTFRIMQQLVETGGTDISIRVLVPSERELDASLIEAATNASTSTSPPMLTGGTATPITSAAVASSSSSFAATASSAEVRGAKLELRYMDKSLTTCPNMLIIDRERCFILEAKSTTMSTTTAATATNNDIYHSIGITSYTKSQSIANSNAAIFETLWKLSEMFEKLESREKAQEEFIKIAAHELRTPVQAVLTYSEIAMVSEGERRGEEDDSSATASASDIPGDRSGSGNVVGSGDGSISPANAGIYRNAVRLKNLVDDLLDVARIENNSFKIYPKPFSLNHLIANVVEDFNSDSVRRGEGGPNIVFKVEEWVRGEEGGERVEGKEEIIVNADKERLTQVLSNLLRNSIEFTKGGTIVVSLRKVPRSASYPSPTIEVTVRDPGKGIDSSIMPLLFSKFSQKSRLGSGLGLYLSKSIIDAHGGRIWGANNEDGAGATFGFSIPLSSESAERAVAQRPF
jgi:two-component system sensor histidine kinase VicK